MAAARNTSQSATPKPTRLGRPTTDIYAIVAHTQDGKPIRVIDRARETLRVGGSLTEVAARCGLERAMVYEWERVGTKVSTEIFAGRRTYAELSKHERKCLDFVQQTVQAEAERVTYWLGLAEKLAAGGFVMETVTEKVDASGKVLERSTKRAVAAPDGTMLRWGLEKARPAMFGQRTAVEVTGAGGGPVQIEATAVIDMLVGEVSRIAENVAAVDDTPAAPAALTNGKG